MPCAIHEMRRRPRNVRVCADFLLSRCDAFFEGEKKREKRGRAGAGAGAGAEKKREKRKEARTDETTE